MIAADMDPGQGAAINPATKRGRILSELATGRKMTRFDAEPLGDHCLPSTVSGLERFGITISRRTVRIEGRHGTFHCAEYWLEDDERQRARIMLGGGNGKA